MNSLNYAYVEFRTSLAQAICYVVRNGNVFSPTRHTHIYCLLGIIKTGFTKRTDATYLAQKNTHIMVKELHIFHNSLYGTNWQR